MSACSGVRRWFLVFARVTASCIALFCMDSSGVSSSLIAPLVSFIKDWPTHHKVVFVPRLQLGKSLETAVARAHPHVGLRCIPAAQYAQMLVNPPLMTASNGAGSTPLPDSVATLIARRALDTLSSGQRKALLHDSPPARVAQALANTFVMLRTYGVSPHNYESALSTAETPTLAQSAKADAYAAYTNLLSEQPYHDRADLLKRARQTVASGAVPDVRDTVYAALHVTTLPTHEAQFVKELAHASTHPLHRIGPRDEQAPPHSVAQLPLFETVPSFALTADTGTPDSSAGTHHFARAVGATEEVRTALRDMQSHQYPHDTVEIAYTASDPYLGLIMQQADRLGIDLALSAGCPLHHTTMGQALRAYLDWVNSSQPLSGLIHLLRGGHLTLHRACPDDGPMPFPNARVASYLAENTCPDGATRILEALKQRIPQTQKHNTEKAGQWAVTYQALQNLLANVPTPNGPMCALASHLHNVLTTYQPSLKDQPERAQKAYERILGHLKTLKQDVPADLETDRPLSERADALRTWMGQTTVASTTPGPGQVHVVPLRAVGYAGRAHLYVVGMDSEALSVSPHEDPLLPDAASKALNATGYRLPRATHRIQYEDRLLRHALQRHTGHAHFIMQHIDPTKSEERFPSALYQQLKQENTQGETETASTLRVEDADLALDAFDTWTLPSSALSDASIPPIAAAEHLAEAYPHIQDGLVAEKARASPDVTEYDGCLPNPPYPELDLFDTERPLSPSRLETLAKTPYLYFVEAVLGVYPPDEPALDDSGWLNPLTKGNILHAAYELFIDDLCGARMPTAADTEALYDALDAALEDAYRERGRPPSRRVEDTIRRTLRQDAVTFLRREVKRAQSDSSLMPQHVEWAFGTDTDADHPAVELPVNGQTLRLRGKADRIDRTNDGLVVLDYKSGGSTGYDPNEGLRNDRRSLQWLLYARAAEKALGVPVNQSGYYFATAREQSKLILYRPDAYHDELNDILTTLATMARTGTFAPAKTTLDMNKWTHNYMSLVADMDNRKDEINKKKWPHHERVHLHHPLADDE